MFRSILRARTFVGGAFIVCATLGFLVSESVAFNHKVCLSGSIGGSCPVSCSYTPQGSSDPVPCTTWNPGPLRACGADPWDQCSSPVICGGQESGGIGYCSCSSPAGSCL